MIRTLYSLSFTFRKQTDMNIWLSSTKNSTLLYKYAEELLNSKHRRHKQVLGNNH